MIVPARLLLAFISYGLCAVASAHEIRPAVVAATIGADRVTIEISANFEAILAGIGPAHGNSDDSPNARIYNDLRALPPAELEARIGRDVGPYLDRQHIRWDTGPAPLAIEKISVRSEPDPRLARMTTLRLTGPVPAGAREFQFAYPARYGACVLKVRRGANEPYRSQWLTNGAAARPFSLRGDDRPASQTEAFGRYLVLGFTHILPQGLDHILFVLGLFLLAARLRPLLIQVTAFTAAHSISLALAVYGVVTLPSALVEPLIAASIAYVAAENVVTPRMRPWRVFMVFGFGLLHGLGFAGVLAEVGLPRNEFLTALVAFNIGVELGQLAVIAAAFLAAGAWFRYRDWYRARITVPASLLIAAIGVYWTIERTVA